MIRRFNGQWSMVNGQTGQSLIEVLLALGVSVAIITAITGAVIASLDNAGFNKNQNLANAYAQEGMEVVREIKDRSWTDFSSIPGGFMCLPEGSFQLQPRSGPNCDGEGNITGGFIRQVRVRNSSDCGVGPQDKKVLVWVQWKDGKCAGSRYCHEVRLISCFVKLNTVGTP